MTERILKHPPYRIVSFTTPEQIQRAFDFDKKIFSKPRSKFDGETVYQPTVTIEDYKRILKSGGKIVTFCDQVTDEIMALGVINLTRDPMAKEPLLQTMEDDTAYMWALAVNPHYQNQGLGGKMLDETLKLAKEAGKTKMITTVHPSNVESLQTFLKRGFLGIARYDSYYPLDDEDGMRFIMLHGDLDNPDWSENQIDPYGSSVETPYPWAIDVKSGGVPAFVGSLFFTLPEEGYCLTQSNRDTDGKPFFRWEKFTGHASLVSKLLYDYPSFKDAYLDKHRLGDVDPHTFGGFDAVAQKALQLVGKYYGTGKIEDLPHSHTMAAQLYRSFINWVSEYRTHILATESDSQNKFQPSSTEGLLLVNSPLHHYILTYLLYENELLWEVIEDRKFTPKKARKYLSEQNIRKFPMEELMPQAGVDGDTYFPTVINKLVDQAVVLYQALELRKKA